MEDVYKVRPRSGMPHFYSHCIGKTCLMSSKGRECQSSGCFLGEETVHKYGGHVISFCHTSQALFSLYQVTAKVNVYPFP